MELIYAALYKLRRECNFQGYIHVKAIPGADQELIQRVGFLADRMSVNLELAYRREPAAPCAPQEQEEYSGADAFGTAEAQ